MGGANNVKHIELHKRYREQQEPKIDIINFIARVVHYGYTKEEAINPGKLLKHRTPNHDNKGRICNQCKQYKKRREFHKSRTGFHKHKSICIQCANENHRSYRSYNENVKDKMYKEEKRKLTIGEYVKFNKSIRKVLDYKFKKGYVVRNIFNDTVLRISTGDNKTSVKVKRLGLELICSECGEKKKENEISKRKGKDIYCKKCAYIEAKLKRSRRILEEKPVHTVMENPIKEIVKIKEDVCPELTPEMFGINVNAVEEEEYY